MAITRRNVARIAAYGALLAVVAWGYGYYDVYARADKACSAVRRASAQADADASVRMSGGALADSGGRRVASFSWLGADVLSCAYRFEGTKLVEFSRGGAK